MARPRAGDWLEDEVAHWAQFGIGIVVNLLERDEVDDLGLGREATLCAQNGIAFFIVPDPRPGAAWQHRGNHAVRGADGTARKAHSYPLPRRNRPLFGDGGGGVDCPGTRPRRRPIRHRKSQRLAIPNTEAQRDWVLRLRER